MKTCSKCNIPKPVAQFRKDPRYAGGRFCWCLDCAHKYGTSLEIRAKNRARRKQKFADPVVREARNAHLRVQYATPKGKRRHKNEMYQRKYGITLEFFESEIKKQKHRCKLCNQIRELVADHNHKTKQYRGAICRLCNIAVGRIEAIPNFIPKVQEYIQ